MEDLLGECGVSGNRASLRHCSKKAARLGVGGTGFDKRLAVTTISALMWRARDWSALGEKSARKTSASNGGDRWEKHSQNTKVSLDG